MPNTRMQPTALSGAQIGARCAFTAGLELLVHFGQPGGG